MTTAMQDALAKALCLLDTFAGEGLGHVYGNGTEINADEACMELCAELGIEFAPGWHREVAIRATPTEADTAAQLAEALDQWLHTVGDQEVVHCGTVVLAALSPKGAE